MLKLTLKDDSVLEVEEGLSAYDIAAKISEGLARAAMNYAANRFAYIAEISKELSSSAFIRLGFSGENVLRVEIPEALMSGCTCGHVN